jgi:hypothetical protein
LYVKRSLVLSTNPNYEKFDPIKPNKNGLRPVEKEV